MCHTDMKEFNTVFVRAEPIWLAPYEEIAVQVASDLDRQY